jgi:hypothetical protein
MAKPEPEGPWFLSPFFDDHLAARCRDERDRRLATSFRDDGFLVLEDCVPIDLVDRIVAETRGLHDPSVPDGPRSRIRVQDAWRVSTAVRELALLETILSLLRWLYGREPFAFQTLNFQYGTEQRPHQDRIFFDSVPSDFMVGVWVALEDVSPRNGSIVYYPGSHRIPATTYADLGLGLRNPARLEAFDENGARLRYEAYLAERVAAMGLPRVDLEVRKGSVLVWAAGLVHGGGPILDRGRTRFSQVTHYFFEDCLFCTPILSNPRTGEIYLRRVENVATGAPVPHRLGPLTLPPPAENGLVRLVLDVDEDGTEVLGSLTHHELRTLERKAIEHAVLETNVRDYKKIVADLVASPSYRLGRALTAPARWLRRRPTRDG